jgi:hypothetical protein
MVLDWNARATAACAFVRKREERFASMPTDRKWSGFAAAVIAGLNGAALCAAQTDFVSAVTATRPIAYYRLDATSGKSEVGSTTYKTQGGASSATPGAPIGVADNHFLQLNGRDGFIVTTQTGGVVSGASIMAWVNLAELPSKKGRLVYVAGESEYGNDLDLQFDTDNGIKFWTTSNGSVSYSPPPATLVNQWHMIVVTVDMATKARAIYWDGKLVASDKGASNAAKKNVFTIGASPVFTGRNFDGGIEEVALWNRALKASEVSAIHAASGSSAGSSGGTASSAASAGGATPTTGPFATTAKVDADDAKGPIKLKREEQIAMMFLTAIEQIEHNCQLNLQRACTMSELMSGKGGEHLKFDPNKTDPNYTYTFSAGGMAWEAHANAKKPGLSGFCYMSRSIGTTVTTYSTTGKAGWTDTEIMSRGISGDSFDTQ